MKKNVLLIGFSLLISSLYAQNDCEEVKKENEYLKKALNITTPVKTATASKIDINLIKCEGDIKQQAVTLTLTLVNHDANKSFQFSRGKAIDVEANEYETFAIDIGSGGSRNKVYTDTPVKTVVRYTKVLPTVKMMKLIGLGYYSDRGESDIEFKDIPIVWK